MELYRQDRRIFLKSAGSLITLPMLESMGVASGNEQSGAPKAKRLVCIGSNLGYYAKAFFPEQAGADYLPSTLLREVDKHRSDYTVFSGVDHRAGNGHRNWDNFLCGNRVGSYSLDQVVADQVGETNRFPSIQLCAGDIPKQRMSFTAKETPLPMLNRPSAVFNKLFTSAVDLERSEYILRSGQSALDTVRDDAKSVQRNVSTADATKLDEYFTSLRALETNIKRQLEHIADGVTEVDYELPPFDPIAPTLMLECEQTMLDLIALALETDSTRVATLFIAGLGQVFTLDGQTMQAGYHALSHHGNDPDLIRDLVRVEREHMRCLDRFLTQLKQRTDSVGRPLLDDTIVLFGTGMGDASRHSNRNLPTLVAGGGLKHGEHIASDPKDDEAMLLGDVYLSILKQFGIHREQFSNAKRGVDKWS